MKCLLVGVTGPTVERLRSFATEKSLGEFQSNCQSLTQDDIIAHWLEHSVIVDTSDIAAEESGGGEETLLLSLASADDVEESSVVQFLEQKLRERLDVSVQCELWASAPAPLPLQSWGNNTGQVLSYFTVNPSNLECAAKIMKQYGCLLQRNLLEDDLIGKLREMIDGEIVKVEKMMARHRSNIRFGEDTFSFKEIASRSKQRFDMRLESNSAIVDFVTDHIFRHNTVRLLLQHTILGGDAESGFEESFDFDCSVVFSRPGSDHQGWHSDGNHLRNSPDAGWEVVGWDSRLQKPYAICLFIPLIDLDNEVGFTQFWPGSHRYRDLLGFGKVAEICQATIDGIVCRGSAIWYDYRLLHRGMPNASIGNVRPILQVIFKTKGYIERVNYGEQSIAQAAI